MRHFRNVGLAVLLLAVSSSASFAQRKVNTGAGASGGGYWEFGVDVAALVLGLDNPSTTDFSLGGGVIRAGKFISDVMSIEPQVAFGYFSTSGSSNTNLNVEVGLLYHLQADRTTGQWYVRPLLDFRRNSSTFSGTTSSNNRMGIGVGFGMKRPSKMNSRFTWRAEATYKNLLKSGSIPSSSDLILSGGVSVFTK